MKIGEIRALSDADIAKQIRDLREEGFKAKFLSSVETIAQPSQLRAIRKNIARLNTEISVRRNKGAAK